MLLVVLVLVVYGSLYPFRFVAAEEVSPRLATLLTSFHFGRSLGDVFANVALFFPIGFLGLRSRHLGTKVSRGDVASICVLGGILGLGLQFGQVFVRGRVPALDDVLWNVVGTLFGAVAAWSLPALLPGLRRRPPRL